MNMTPEERENRAHYFWEFMKKGEEQKEWVRTQIAQLSEEEVDEIQMHFYLLKISEELWRLMKEKSIVTASYCVEEKNDEEE